MMRSLLAPRIKFCAVVKSNAYGHYLHRFAKEALTAGVDMLAVDSFVEAKAIRTEGIMLPVFVLGFTLPAHYIDATSQGVALTISSLDQLEAVEASGVKYLHVHIKLDTGMHRQGFQKENLTKSIPLMLELIKNNTMHIVGTYSHLAAAKSREHSELSLVQKTRFDEMVNILRAEGIEPGIVHLAASGGALMYSEMHYDMVRIGMANYGHWPSSDVREINEKNISLSPALSWRSVVGEVKSVKSGERVGYDGTHVLMRDSVLAVVPVGYWHGLDRGLGDRADVLVCGSRARVVGRVSMDMIVIDVTDIRDVKAGDTVTIIGRDGREEVSAEELANHIDTTAYEILTRINPLIERIYT